MSSKSSFGSKALNLNPIEPVIGQGKYVIGTAATNGTFAITAPACYRISNIGAAGMHVGVNAVHDGTNFTGTAIIATIGVGAYQDVLIPPGFSVMHYVGNGIITLVKHAE